MVGNSMRSASVRSDSLPRPAWRWWADAPVAVFVLAGISVSLSCGSTDIELDAAGSATTTEPGASTEQRSTTTEDVTTTTRAASPEGGFRSSDTDLTTDGGVADQLSRRAVTSGDVVLLDSLAVESEHAGGYDRAAFPHWDDADGDGCDTRCEVLSSQRLADGSWFSEWDGATEVDASLVHVDHVVALAEAWRSGAHAWTPAQRDDFADDRTNLIAVTAASNIRKRDKDAASWFPSRSEANCLWARTVVTVKAAWDLSVDRPERDALRNLLVTCGGGPATTTSTTSTSSSTTTAPPAPVTAAPPVTQPPPPPADDCTPGYSPCLPPAEDYDCAGGSGNGPAYTGRVTVDHAYGDPYDLDRDGDGVGCEN